MRVSGTSFDLLKSLERTPVLPVLHEWVGMQSSVVAVCCICTKLSCIKGPTLSLDAPNA